MSQIINLILNNSSTRIYQLSRDGSLIGYLNTKTVTGSSGNSGPQFSGIATDPTNGYLWSVNDTTGHAHVWHYTIHGNLISDFPGSNIDSSITELEGVTVDPNDGSLYFVDDTVDFSVDPQGVQLSRLWHCQRNGQPVAGFSPINLRDFGVRSVQEIEYDKTTDTLLVICNQTSAVYRITLTGILLSTTNLLWIEPQPVSWQGIAVDLDPNHLGYWWLSGYSSDPTNNRATLVQVNPNTGEVLSDLSDAAAELPVAGDLSGVTFYHSS